VRNEFFDDGGEDDTGLSHAVAQIGMFGTGGASSIPREETMGVGVGPSESRGQKSRWFSSVKEKLKGRK